jgi:hypothetical protein
MNKCIIILALFLLCLGCANIPKENNATTKSIKQIEDKELLTLTLQYRIWMDAVAPSQFVAIYKDGMTLGLKIKWKISKVKKSKLDELLNKLEEEGINGKEFIAKAKWIREGCEIEVYEIKEKF